jgi:hypothetical protein
MFSYFMFMVYLIENYTHFSCFKLHLKNLLDFFFSSSTFFYYTSLNAFFLVSPNSSLHIYGVFNRELYSTCMLLLMQCNFSHLLCPQTLLLFSHFIFMVYSIENYTQHVCFYSCNVISLTCCVPKLFSCSLISYLWCIQ